MPLGIWVEQHRNPKMHQVDPKRGKILRNIEPNRFVTGVTYVAKELWRGTWEEKKSDLRRVDPQSAEALELIEMPQGVGVSGGTSGMVKGVQKPKRKSKAVLAQ